MSKINNYYLSNDSKNIILVYDNFTSILNLNTNKEIKIIDKELDKITFSKDGFFFVEYSIIIQFLITTLQN